MADALDLKSNEETRVGSTPTRGTISIKQYKAIMKILTEEDLDKLMSKLPSKIRILAKNIDIFMKHRGKHDS